MDCRVRLLVRGPRSAFWQRARAVAVALGSQIGLRRGVDSIGRSTIPGPLRSNSARLRSKRERGLLSKEKRIVRFPAGPAPWPQEPVGGDGRSQRSSNRRAWIMAIGRQIVRPKAIWFAPATMSVTAPQKENPTMPRSVGIGRVGKAADRQHRNIGPCEICRRPDRPKVSRFRGWNGATTILKPA